MRTPLRGTTFVDELVRKSIREHIYWSVPELFEAYGDPSVPEEVPVDYEEWRRRSPWLKGKLVSIDG